MSQRDTTTRYTIGDNDGYVKFIEELRGKPFLRKKPPLEYNQDGRTVQKTELPDQRKGKQPELWIEIELRSTDTEGVASTTLVARNDNLFVKGFKNGKGEWFQFGLKATEKLPFEFYKEAQHVGWDVKYSSIMGLKGVPQVERTLKTARLGRAFAKRAVRRLCGYPETKYNDDKPVRLGLAGLLVMIFEAARMDDFLEYFAGKKDDAGKFEGGAAWDQGKGLELEGEKLFRHLWNWGNMSIALRNLALDPDKVWYSGCDVDSAEASESVHLVLCGSRIQRSSVAVEIFEVFVNFPCSKIQVIDEQRGNWGTMHEDKNQQDNEEMRRFELTVHNRCLSGHEWFIKVPPPSGTTGDKMSEFKWDWREQAGRQAGKTTYYLKMSEPVPVMATTDSGDMELKKKKDSGDMVIKATYLVMSEPMKVTVDVKLRLQDEQLTLDHEKMDSAFQENDSNKYTAYGKITAHIIGDFGRHPILLLKTEEAEVKQGNIPLGRSKIDVPEDGKGFQIDMNGLGIKTCSSSNQSGDVKKRAGTGSGDNKQLLSFPQKESRSEFLETEGVSLQVDVAWVDVPYLPEIDAWFTISDNKDLFTNFIVNDVRKEFEDKDQPPNGTYCLTKPRPTNGRPEKWIHIELKVKVGDEKFEKTTLAVQPGKCYGVGFMNQSQVWYDLGSGKQAGQRKAQLPVVYSSVLLGWGLAYDDILDLPMNNWDGVYERFKDAGLGSKGFVEKAVRTLWRYPDVDDKDDLNPRVAVAGLILMVCESARFDPLLKYFEDNWNKDTVTKLSMKEMKYICSWGKISRALMLSKDKDQWSEIDDKASNLNNMGITKQDALDKVHLVYYNAQALKFRPTHENPTTSGGSTATSSTMHGMENK